MNQPKLDPKTKRRFEKWFPSEISGTGSGLFTLPMYKKEKFEMFLAQEIARERDQVLSEINKMITPSTYTSEQECFETMAEIEHKTLTQDHIKYLTPKMEDNSLSNVNQEKDNVTSNVNSVECDSEKTRPTGEDYNKLEDGGIY